MKLESVISDPDMFFVFNECVINSTFVSTKGFSKMSVFYLVALLIFVQCFFSDLLNFWKNRSKSFISLYYDIGFNGFCFVFLQ